ncbi:hypothetical protein D3C80_1133180 [compost metagenome]
MVVAIELHLDAVEVVLAAVDRQVLAPPVLHPFEHHASARHHLGDAVGAAAQRRLVAGGLEVALAPVVLRQYRQLAEAQDQQRIAAALEHEAHPVAVENVDPLDFLEGGAVVRMAVAAEQAVGEGHVVGGDRLVVVEARLGTQVEHHPAAVLAVLHRGGDQAVAGGRLVTRRIVGAGAGHQRGIQFGDAVLQEVAGTGRAGALEGVGVEGVEGAGGHQSHAAALGRVGVDPVEMAEVGRVLERTELGVAVAFRDGGASGQAGSQTEQQGEETTHQARVRSVAVL